MGIPRASRRFSNRVGTLCASNVPRLRLIMGLFRVRQRDICVTTGYSKAYESE